MKTRKPLLFFWLLGLTLVYAQQPNILIIIADDLGGDDLGCYGHPTVQTPSIDALSELGLRFDNAFLTTSSCSPSRASIITGRYPHNTGAGELHLHLPDSQVPNTLPFFLKQAGYHTALAGKHHFGEGGSFDETFDVVLSAPKDTPDPGTDRWIDLLRERPKDKPFFFWFASVDPHLPWPDNEFMALYGPEDAIIPPFFPDTPAMRRFFINYYSEVSRFDSDIGRVVEELKRQGIFEDTLIIILSDNGRPFPRCKTTLLDSGVQTPLIIAGHIDEGVRGKVAKGMVSSIDIAPTIMEMAGLPVPETMQGISLVPVTQYPQASVRDYVFAERNWHVYSAHQRMIRDKHYLFIRNYAPRQDNPILQIDMAQELRRSGENGATTPMQDALLFEPEPVEQLYAVNEDPYQIVNLAGDPAYAAIQDRMSDLLEQWRIRTADFPSSPITPDRNNPETGQRYPQYDGLWRPELAIDELVLERALMNNSRQ